MMGNIAFLNIFAVSMYESLQVTSPLTCI